MSTIDPKPVVRYAPCNFMPPPPPNQPSATSPLFFENLHFEHFDKNHAPQTKILEWGTKDEMRMFEVLFNGSWPKLSTHALEKCFEIIISSFGWGKNVNHESRLTLLSKCSKWRLSKKSGLIADGCPKRRFWKDEQRMKSGCSKHFSRAWVLNLGDEPLKSASNIHISA